MINNCRSKSGKRKDLDNQFFRSKTEANFARYLRQVLKEDYQYETKTFYFEKIKRGIRSYTPDFYVESKDCYYEVKGWLDPHSVTKLKRFKKYYPDEFRKLIIIKQSLTRKDQGILYNKIGFGFGQIWDFNIISVYSKLLKGWE